MLSTSIKNAGAYLYASVLVIILSISSFQASAHFGSKGPFGGTVSCAIARDSLVYLGTGNGGVYISSGNALTGWTARPVGLTSGKITALAHSGTYLFAGTADSGVFVFNGFVGTDRYWIKINNGLGNLKIRSLLALDSITLLAGTDGSGLYKTTDKGATWTAVAGSLINTKNITGIVKAGNRIILMSQNSGVFKSDDDGNTWDDLNDANTRNVTATNSFSYNSLTDVLLVSNANGVYALASAGTANAASYTAVQTGLPGGVSVRGISNNGTDWYLATNLGVFTAPASAVNWIAANNGLPLTDVTAVVALQNRLIAGVSRQGVFKATAGVHAWAESNTGFNNPVTHTMEAAGDSLVIAVTDKGVFVSKNLATSYVRSNTGLTDSLHVTDIILAQNRLLAATKNGGVFSSQDSGATWMAANTGLASLHIKKLFHATHHVYAIDSAGNVFEATLPAISWAAIQDGLPANVNPTSIAFYGGKLILGTSGNGVYMRDQHEGPWQAANTGLSNLVVTAVAASGNKIFAGTSGSGVFVSDFAAVSWSQTAPTSVAFTAMIGLNGNNIQSVASYAGYVYAGYKGGVLTSSDNGATWIPGGTQFNLPSFTDVNKICFVSSRVFVPTENNGIYSNALSELPPLRDTLIVSQETITFPSVPDEETAVSVTSNRAWTVSADQAWITLSANAGVRNGDLTIAVSPNTGPARTGAVTVTAGVKIKTISLVQGGVTGLGEVDALQAALRLYPNPSEGRFTVDVTALKATVRTVSLYDITGKELAVKTIGNDTSSVFDFNYAPGIYFVKLDTDKGAISRKVLIR